MSLFEEHNPDVFTYLIFRTFMHSNSNSGITIATIPSIEHIVGKSECCRMGILGSAGKEQGSVWLTGNIFLFPAHEVDTKLPNQACRLPDAGNIGPCLYKVKSAGKDLE